MTQNRLFELALRAMFRTISDAELLELTKEVLANQRSCRQVFAWKAKLQSLSADSAAGDRTDG